MQLHAETILPTAPRRVHDELADRGPTDSASVVVTTDIDPILGGAILGVAQRDMLEPLGGDIEVRDIELVPGERVVQAWRISDWESGVYSLVRMTLMRDGEGTRMILDRVGPLKKFLAA
jgi:hypothetical protein